MEPRWLTAARKDIGLREIPGAPTAPRIAQMLSSLRAWWSDDETPWCGTAVASWMKESSLPVPKAWYRAREWAAWGSPLTVPVLGCVVVFERKGGGHVGLVVGRDPRGRLLVLGGNQGDSVNISPFDTQRVLAYRWPTGYTDPQLPLPVLVSSAASSVNEA